MRASGVSLTGDTDTVDRFGERFGLTVVRGTGRPEEFVHSLKTVVIDGDGRVRRIYSGTDWAPADLVTRAARGRPLMAAHRAPWVTLRHATAFTAAERRLIDRLRTPAAVQAYLNALPYNTERGGETLRSFRGVVRTGTAHCLEAALFAAVVLEQHGYPPLVLSFESVDLLDHVIFVYRHRGRWGSIARSRDPGLHGRKPLFATPRALALSYVDPYVDYTGEVRGYAVVDMRAAGHLRLAARRHATSGRWSGCCSTIRTGGSGPYPRRIARLRARYLRFRAEHPDVKPVLLPGPRAMDAAAEGLPGCRNDRTRGAQRLARADPAASRQSRSKSRVGFVIGSVFACLSASSKRFASASPRPRSASTDCWNIASRRAACSATMRVAWSSSGLSARSGSRWLMTRPRLVSMRSVGLAAGTR